MTETICAAIEAKRGRPEDVLAFIEPGADIVVGAANGEPVRVIDALEEAAVSLDDVRLHQMLAMRPRPYIDGQRPDAAHVRRQPAARLRHRRVLRVELRSGATCPRPPRARSADRRTGR